MMSSCRLHSQLALAENVLGAGIQDTLTLLYTCSSVASIELASSTLLSMSVADSFKHLNEVG